MRPNLKSAICMLALALLVAGPAMAQPPEGQRPGGAGAMGARFNVEQLMGSLAFDEKIGVTDDQLIKLRGALKEIYGKQQDMMKKLRGGSREGMRERMTAMRTEMMTMRTQMMEKIATVLNEKQVEQLKKTMQRAQSQRGGRQGRGGRQREGGRSRNQ